jgi:hypothetical protein
MAGVIAMFAKRDTVIPDTHRDLLERPLFGHVGTLRDDGAVQVNPMWFSFEASGCGSRRRPRGESTATCWPTRC